MARPGAEQMEALPDGPRGYRPGSPLVLVASSACLVWVRDENIAELLSSNSPILGISHDQQQWTMMVNKGLSQE